MQKRGRLFIIAAPSGTGKSTIVNYLMDQGLNMHFSIYNEFTGQDKVMQKQGVFQTALDKVVLGEGIAGMRVGKSGVVYQDGVDVEKLEYYQFYRESGVNNKICLPPFIPNGKECLSPSITDNYNYNIPILMCKIGLEPQICKENEEFVDINFNGFA